jgi:hypothetical protein
MALDVYLPLICLLPHLLTYLMVFFFNFLIETIMLLNFDVGVTHCLKLLFFNLFINHYNSEISPLPIFR